MQQSVARIVSSLHPWKAAGWWPGSTAADASDGHCSWVPPTGRSGWSGASPPASPTSGRPTGSSTGWRPWWGSGCSGSRWATRIGRPRRPAPRPGAGRDHGQAGRTPRRLRRARGQVDPEPARACAGRPTLALPQDRPRRGLDRAAVRRLVPRRSCRAARGDRPRPGRDRRSAARQPRRALLSRLLWLLLLSAALRLLRRSAAGRQAPAVEHQRQRRRRRGGRTDRRADPRPLAGSADHPARRARASPARR